MLKIVVLAMCISFFMPANGMEEYSEAQLVLIEKYGTCNLRELGPKDAQYQLLLNESIEEYKKSVNCGETAERACLLELFDKFDKQEENGLYLLIELGEESKKLGEEVIRRYLDVRTEYAGPWWEADLFKGFDTNIQKTSNQSEEKNNPFLIDQTIKILDELDNKNKADKLYNGTEEDLDDLKRIRPSL